MPIIVPPFARQTCQTLKEHGYQAFLVGGAIRDSLLGLEPTDWDITTNALPCEIEQLFTKSLPTGKQFGTVTVFLGNQALEITTMRCDGPYSDGRHPDYITFTDRLELDLSRRDFTINALAYDPFQEQIIDYFSGIKHLKKKLLVTVGDPALRFSEDPLRMLRLVRFQATLGFKIDKKTRLTLQKLTRLIQKISPERVLAELNKMLLGKELFAALQTFYTSGLMAEIIPELAQSQGVPPGQSHPYDLLGHAMAAAHFAHPVLSLRWAALLHDVGKLETLEREHAQIGAGMARRILQRLRASNALIEQVSFLIAQHMFEISPHSTDKAIRKFLALVGPETAFELIKLRQADMAGLNADPRQILDFGEAMGARLNAVLAQENVLTLKCLQIDGHTLLEIFKLKPGPLVGEILQHLFEQVLDDPTLNQREELLDRAGRFLESLPKN